MRPYLRNREDVLEAMYDDLGHDPASHVQALREFAETWGYRSDWVAYEFQKWHGRFPDRRDGWQWSGQEPAPSYRR